MGRTALPGAPARQAGRSFLLALALGVSSLVLEDRLIQSAGGQESTASPSGAPVAVAGSPTGGATAADFEELSRRLEQTEAEVRQLRSQLPPTGTIQAGYDPDAMQPPVEGGGWQTPFGELQKKFNDLQQAYQTDKDTLPRIKINGVFQADQGWFNQDPNSKTTFGNPLFPGDTTPPQPGGGKIQDGGDFRRARLAASGQITENMNGFFQMDFAFFGRPTFTDVWGEYTHLPLLGSVRIGQWKQPFSLEVVSSFRYTTFAERSLLFQAFAPFRHLGVGAYNNWGGLSGTWAFSLYKAGQDQFGDSLSTAGGNALVGRTTWCPYYDEPAGGRYYLHLGSGYAFVNPENNLARFRTSPEIYIGEVSNAVVGTSGQNVSGLANGTPFFVDTGNIRTKGYSLYGSELLWVNGPLSIQNECMAVNVSQIGGGADLTYWGQYTSIGYFLTGEHRPYDRKLGVIDRVIPFENVFRVKRGDCIGTGIGAWEVATRWSYIDLNSGPINFGGQSNFNPTAGGGRLNDWTFGVNWYHNPYSKMQFNFIRAMLANNTFGRSNTNIFDLRYQIDF
jgi:phosphate-selective porin OprO and OprP